jgi:hypothetical protein
MVPGAPSGGVAALERRRLISREAREVLSRIRMLQESYRSEFSMYCDVSSATHDGTRGVAASHWPTSAATADPVPWGTPPIEWQQLGFRRIEPVYFRYEVVAGNAGVPMPGAPQVPSDPWWIARAYGDLDGNGVRSTFEARSNQAGLQVRPDDIE